MSATYIAWEPLSAGCYPQTSVALLPTCLCPFSSFNLECLQLLRNAWSTFSFLLMKFPLLWSHNYPFPPQVEIVSPLEASSAAVWIFSAPHLMLYQLLTHAGGQVPRWQRLHLWILRLSTVSQHSAKARYQVGISKMCWMDRNLTSISRPE